ILAPLHRSSRFVLHILSLHVLLCLDFADQFGSLGLDNEVRLVLGITLKINLEGFLARLEPFHNIGVIFEQNRKTTLGVGLEPLSRIEALLESTEKHSTDQQLFFDWNSNVPWLLASRNRIAAGTQRREALGDVCFVLADL